jgi:hypothetical protein
MLTQVTQGTLIYSPRTPLDVSCGWINPGKSMGGEVHGRVGVEELAS